MSTKSKAKETLGIKVDPELKEKFVNLAKEEKLSITDAVEFLMVEALHRGYIIKERHETLLTNKTEVKK